MLYLIEEQMAYSGFSYSSSVYLDISITEVIRKLEALNLERKTLYRKTGECCYEYKVSDKYFEMITLLRLLPWDNGTYIKMITVFYPFSRTIFVLSFFFKPYFRYRQAKDIICLESLLVNK